MDEISYSNPSMWLHCDVCNRPRCNHMDEISYSNICDVALHSPRLKQPSYRLSRQICSCLDLLALGAVASPRIILECVVLLPSSVTSKRNLRPPSLVTQMIQNKLLLLLPPHPFMMIIIIFGGPARHRFLHVAVIQSRRHSR